MSRLLSPGVYALIVTLAAGVWMTISPWVMEGAVWSPGTISNLAAGGILIGAGLVGTCVYLALALRDAALAAREARTRRAPSAQSA